MLEIGNEKRVDAYNQVVQSHIEKGKTYFWKEGFTTEKAIECFNQAIALNPENSEAYDIKGNCLRYLLV